MKKIIGIITGMLLLATVSGLLWAKEKAAVAILPFTVRSAISDNIDYMQDGVWDILSSRLSTEEKIEVINKDTTLEAMKGTEKKELKLKDLYNIGKKLGADYLIGGSIVKIGKNLSIDGKLIDVAANKPVATISTQCQNIDEVIPKINDFAGIAQAEITKTLLAAQAPPPPVVTSPPPVQVPSEVIKKNRPEEKEIPKITKEAALNPEFITAPQPAVGKGSWISKEIPTAFKGMDIGDVNNDGINEVITIDKHNLTLYQLKDNTLTLVQQIPGEKSDNYLAVDVADINRNGTKEIIVTNVIRDQPRSFAIEFREGKFEKIVADIPWFLRVINSSSRSNVLLGQKLSVAGTFYSPIYEMTWNGKHYVSDKKINVPEGFSIYGLTMDHLEPNGNEKIIALDDRDFICIFEDTGKPFVKLNELGGSKDTLWKSDDLFGGSSVYFEVPGAQISDSGKNIYINLRILTYDANQDGKNEVIIAKNLSPLGRVFRSVNIFTSSEINDLEWEGLGLSENWKTKKISGYVADYQIKDINNDGKDDLVLAMVASSGTFTEDRSVIMVYNLLAQ
jgi:TolB-like protein